jgi:hypothetical protein
MGGRINAIHSTVVMDTEMAMFNLNQIEQDSPTGG